MHDIDEQKALEKITLETGLSAEEIKAKVKQKQDEMKGLINKASALIIFSKEIGVDVNLFCTRKAPLEQQEIDIAQIEDQMRGVAIKGRVLSFSAVKNFVNKRNGKNGTMAWLFLRDNTKDIRVILWGEFTRLISDDHIQKGKILRLSGFHAKKSPNGTIELSSTSSSKVDYQPNIPEDSIIQIDQEIIGLQSLNLDNQFVSTRGVVIKIYQPSKAFSERLGRHYTKGSLILGEEKQQVQVLFWNEQTESLKEIKEGDQILLKNVKIKQNYYNQDEIDLEFQKDSSWDKIGEQSFGEEKIAEILSQKLLTANFSGQIQNIETKEIKKKDGSQTSLTIVTVSDDTGTIELQLWGENGIQLTEKFVINDSIKVSGRKRFDNYSQRYKITVNDFDNIQKLDELKFTPVEMKLVEIPVTASRRRIGELKDNGKGLVQVRGLVHRSLIHVYNSCSTCRRKLSDCSCEQSTPSKGLIITLVVDDDSESIKVKMFNSIAEQILETPSSIFNDFEVEDIQEPFNEKIRGKEYLFTGYPKLNTFSDALELHVKSYEKLDVERELEFLLNGN